MKILSTSIKAAILILFVYAFFVASAQASVYKCADVDGNIEYTDKACANPLPIQDNLTVFKDNELRDSEKKMLEQFEYNRILNSHISSTIIYTILTVESPKR